MRVAVLGASNNPEKYSYLALKFLREKGHEVFPIHPSLKVIDDMTVYSSLQDVPSPIDTISLYVSPEISSKLSQEIISAHPRRILMNPGAENPALETLAAQHHILTQRACTLVLLRTNQF